MVYKRLSKEKKFARRRENRKRWAKRNMGRTMKQLAKRHPLYLLDMR